MAIINCRGCFCLEQFVFGHDFIDSKSVWTQQCFQRKMCFSTKKLDWKNKYLCKILIFDLKVFTDVQMNVKEERGQGMGERFLLCCEDFIRMMFSHQCHHHQFVYEKCKQQLSKTHVSYICSSHVLRHLFVSHLVEINNLLRYRYRENVISLEVSWNANIRDFSHAWNELENWICLRVTCPGGSGPLTGQFPPILAPISSTQFGSKFLTNDLQVLNSPFQQYNGIRLLFIDNLCELGAAAADCFVGFTSFTVVMIFQHAGNNKVVLCLHKW